MKILKDPREVVTFENENDNTLCGSVSFVLALPCKETQGLPPIETITLIDEDKEKITFQIEADESNQINQLMLDFMATGRFSSGPKPVCLTGLDGEELSVSYTNYGEPYIQGVYFSFEQNDDRLTVFIEAYALISLYIKRLKA